MVFSPVEEGRKFISNIKIDRLLEKEACSHVRTGPIYFRLSSPTSPFPKHQMYKNDMDSSSSDDPLMDPLLLEPRPLRESSDDRHIQQHSALPVLHGGCFSMSMHHQQQQKTGDGTSSSMPAMNPGHFPVHEQYASLVHRDSSSSSSSYTGGNHLIDLMPRMLPPIPPPTEAAMSHNTQFMAPMFHGEQLNQDILEPNPIGPIQASGNQQLFRLFQDGEYTNLNSGFLRPSLGSTTVLPSPMSTSYNSTPVGASSARRMTLPMGDILSDDKDRVIGGNSDDVAIRGTTDQAASSVSQQSSESVKLPKRGKKKSLDQFRMRQSDHWSDRFGELVAYHNRHGHCLVPNSYTENVPLAEWVKRQRYQYKLKQLGHHSSMTDERIAALESLDFVWNSHDQTWEERLNDLKEYKRQYGHCDVRIGGHTANPQLGLWAKVRRLSTENAERRRIRRP